MGRWLQALRQRENRAEPPSDETLKTLKTGTEEVSMVLRVRAEPVFAENPVSLLAPRGASGDEEQASICAELAAIPEEFARAFIQMQAMATKVLGERAGRGAIDDAGRFLDRWGSQAAALGWSDEALFGVPEYGAKGLLWELEGMEVVALSEQTAALSDDGGPARAWYCRPLPGPTAK